MSIKMLFSYKNLSIIKMCYLKLSLFVPFCDLFIQKNNVVLVKHEYIYSILLNMLLSRLLRHRNYWYVFWELVMLIRKYRLNIYIYIYNGSIIIQGSVSFIVILVFNAYYSLSKR